MYCSTAVFRASNDVVFDSVVSKSFTPVVTPSKTSLESETRADQIGSRFYEIGESARRGGYGGC